MGIQKKKQISSPGILWIQKTDKENSKEIFCNNPL